MNILQKRPSWFAMVTLLWLAFSTRNALAFDVVIAYHDVLLEPLSQRLSSELGSEGHRARVEKLADEPGCASYTNTPAPTHTAFERVWIQLGRVTDSRDAGCAAISVPTSRGMRQAHVTASLNDVQRFAIQVAEALNGLSSRAPAPAPNDPSVSAPKPDAPQELKTERPPLSLAASGIVLLDVRHPSPLIGVGLMAELPLSTDLDLQLETGWTISPLRLEGPDAELLARLAWARLGGALRLLPHPTELNLLVGAGAALTWVTARVEPPLVARADIAPSASLSAGVLFAYPSDSVLHGYAGLRASTLIPTIRFDLPSGPTSPFGALLAEGAIGVRASW